MGRCEPHMRGILILVQSWPPLTAGHGALTPVVPACTQPMPFVAKSTGEMAAVHHPRVGSVEREQHEHPVMAALQGEPDRSDIRS